ncbi:Crp/Fnr family transcriptional regulator [Thermodesulfobacteriota bacterium]
MRTSSLFEESRTYSPGEVIIEQGEDSRDLFYITLGTIEVSVRGEEGGYSHSELAAPQILGELSFMDGAPRTATVRAKTEVKAHVIVFENVKDEMAHLPLWTKPVFRAFSKRIVELNKRIRDLEEKVDAMNALNEFLLKRE